MQMRNQGGVEEEGLLPPLTYIQTGKRGEGKEKTREREGKRRKERHVLITPPPTLFRVRL